MYIWVDIQTIVQKIEVGIDSSCDLLQEYTDEPNTPDVVESSKAEGYIECLQDLKKLIAGQTEENFELIYNPFQGG